MAEQIIQEMLTGERALFQGHDLHVQYSTFGEGESPLKESENTVIEQSSFGWKYPLWYSKHADVQDSSLRDMARAGIWYSDDITIADTIIQAPKTFRRSTNITLERVTMLNAAETLWMCGDIVMKDVTAAGDYFAMNSNRIRIDGFRLTGNYSFDGCRDVEVRGAQMLSKDAFWNCENVTVYDSSISGEYIGWNSKNLTFVNCTIESLQGFCYIDNLVLKNCRLINTNLAFEYCTVDADVTTTIDSIKNPISGVIRASSIGEVIMDDPKINPRNTRIVVGELKNAV